MSVTEAGTRGQLKRSHLPYAMGDLVPRPEPGNIFWWRDIDLILMTYLTHEEAAAAALPSEFSLQPVQAHGLAALGLAFERVRVGGGLAVASLAFAMYRAGTTIGPYGEVFLGIPCLYQGQPYIYCAYIYVDTDAAAAAGRELLGAPKKLAHFELNSSGAHYAGTMDRGGTRVVSVTFTEQNKLFDLPLPANEKVDLPGPYDQVLMLPEPTGKPHGLPIPMVTTRFVADDSVPAHIAIPPQHIYSDWNLEKGTVWGGEGRLEYGSSKADPLARLPVVHMLASIRFHGDMSNYVDHAHVVAEMA